MQHCIAADLTHCIAADLTPWETRVAEALPAAAGRGRMLSSKACLLHDWADRGHRSFSRGVELATKAPGVRDGRGKRRAARLSVAGQLG